jgi:transposase-like protein
MAPTNDASTTDIIKADARGRTRYTEEYKREVLDAFEQSGLSGMQFAKRCGVKYPTFASWVKRRKQAANGHGDGEAGPPVGANPFIIAEIREDESASGLSVTFPGGVVARATTREQIVLLVELMRALA